MQYLKDEIRQRILAAAREEFYTQGFTDASIRVIAKNAGISSGNVYRYFPSKALIFDELVGDVYEQFIQTLSEIEAQQTKKDLSHPSDCKSCLERVDKAVLGLFASHQLEIRLLLFKSQGSAYANLKGEMLRLVQSTLLKSLPFDKMPETLANEHELAAGALAACLVESTCYVLEHSKEQTPINSLLNEIVLLHSLGLQHYFARFN